LPASTNEMTMRRHKKIVEDLKSVHRKIIVIWIDNKRVRNITKARMIQHLCLGYLHQFAGCCDTSADLPGKLQNLASGAIPYSRTRGGAFCRSLNSFRVFTELVTRHLLLCECVGVHTHSTRGLSHPSTLPTVLYQKNSQFLG